jgi:hypothetical protein
VGYTTTPKNVSLDAIGANATWISFHTGDPGSNGANEVAGGLYTREQTAWGAAGSAAKVGSQVTADIPAATTITHWGLWTASSGGTFYYGGPLSASESFGGAGTYLFTPTLTQAG